MSLSNLLTPNGFSIYNRKNTSNILQVGEIVIQDDNVASGTFTTSELEAALLGGGGGGGSLPTNMTPNNMLVALSSTTVNTSDYITTPPILCSTSLDINDTLSCKNQFALGHLITTDNLGSNQSITTTQLYNAVTSIPVNLSYAKYENNSGQPFPITSTKVYLDTIVFQHNISLGTPADTVVITNAGYYQINAAISFQTTIGVTGYVTAFCTVNGTVSDNNLYSAMSLPTIRNQQGITCNYTLQLAANDQVAFWIQNATSGSLSAYKGVFSIQQFA